MASFRSLFALAAAFAALSEAAQQQALSQYALNPIRKVVTLLQTMQTKVTAEGKKEKELYDKFMCYCQTGTSDLTGSIAAAEAKITSLSSQLEASDGTLVQAKAELVQAQGDREAAKAAVAEATALRANEAAAFASLKAEYETNIAAIAKAVAALEKGMGGSFLQTGAAQTLRQLATSEVEMLEVDRRELLAFLGQGSGYAPQSGEITGILKQLGDSMAKTLADAIATEGGAVQTYEGMMVAKKAETAAITTALETKTEQIGELGVRLVNMKEDLDDTTSTLAEDKNFLAGLGASCSTKTAEWEERSKTRADELVALADTIKVLNDDDALELFKKTLPSASSSFVQLAVTAAALRKQALVVVRGARRGANPQDRPGLDLLALALAGKRALTGGPFDKVVSMIDTMVAVLKKEQVDDDGKQEYCAAQLQLADDKRKVLERSVSDEDGTIAAAEEAVSTLASEIAALEAGIQALDKSVAEATVQRKAENSEFQALMASDAAAKEILVFAKNRLNKFYNPKLFKAAPRVVLSTEDRTFSNMGGTVNAAAPGGIAGTDAAVLVQVALHSQRTAAASPAPETWAAYSKKSEENTGVLAMMDLLIADLEKEMTEAQVDEKNAQASYETLTADSTEKRAADSRALTEKGAAKADLEAQLQVHKESRKEAVSQLMATGKYIASLHAECDWLLQFFDIRKEARAGEIDALTKAKAVLSGADYSLLQTRSHGHLRRSVSA